MISYKTLIVYIYYVTKILNFTNENIVFHRHIKDS